MTTLDARYLSYELECANRWIAHINAIVGAFLLAHPEYEDELGAAACSGDGGG